MQQKLLQIALIGIIVVAIGCGGNNSNAQGRFKERLSITHKQILQGDY